MWWENNNEVIGKNWKIWNWPPMSFKQAKNSGPTANLVLKNVALRMFYSLDGNQNQGTLDFVAKV